MDYCTLAWKHLLLLSVAIHLTSAVSLCYFYNAVTPGINFPEFTLIGMVDGEQFVYYDSNIKKMIPKADWIKTNVGEDYWSKETKTAQVAEEVFKVDVDILMKRFNHTKGVHTVQLMYGCELDTNGIKKGYNQFAYDGDDFIILDLNTSTWTAANAKAVISKNYWEKAGDAMVQKSYLENQCIKSLQTYVGYGRDTLERKVRPQVSLFQKDSSSPVVCHATGFYPKAVNISWKKNREDLDEHVELRETLPNQDGTFQKRSVLTVSPEELDKHHYSCTVQHSSLEKERVLQVSSLRVLSEWRPQSNVHFSR